MTRTLRGVAALLTATITGAALAAGPSTSALQAGPQAPAASGVVGQALANTQVRLLAGPPGSGAAVIARVNAAQLVNGITSPALSGARYAVLSVGGDSAAFAVAASSGRLGPTFAVAGVPGTVGGSGVPLSVLATYLYEAVNGMGPAVLLEHGHGAGAVTFAAYDPAMPTAGLDTSGAAQVTAFVNGHATTYPVRASGRGLQGLEIASGAHRGQPVSAVIG
ncbi:MAG: hypothetical protein P8Z81_05860 [Deinococcales bacterium]